MKSFVNLKLNRLQTINATVPLQLCGITSSGTLIAVSHSFHLSSFIILSLFTTFQLSSHSLTQLFSFLDSLSGHAFTLRAPRCWGSYGRWLGRWKLLGRWSRYGGSGSRARQESWSFSTSAHTCTETQPTPSPC